MKNEFMKIVIATALLILFAGNASATVTVKNLEKLTDNPYMDTEPDWNPDDSKIIYMQYFSDWWTALHIAEMNADGTGKRQIIPHDDYAYWHAKYSPDGTKIAYESYIGALTLKYVNNGTVEILVPGEWGYFGVRSYWSPDSKKIVYSRLDDSIGRAEIWIYDLEARTNIKLTNENVEERYPTWSPDGTKIAYQREGDIWLMNPDGTEKVDITNTSNIYEDPYSWSPDSSMIAYTSFEILPDGERVSFNDISVINRDGTGMAKLTTDNSFHDSHPAWSHSGDKIAFESARSGNYDIWVMEISFNQAPTTDAGGPYEVNENSMITLDGSGSSDPDDNIILYEWDLDNDGQYDDATGVTTNVVFGDDVSFTVGLKITDDDGEIDYNTTTVTVNNVDPTIDPLTIYTINENEEISLQCTATDPGSDDLVFTWNWGDGTSDTVNTYYNNDMSSDPYPSPKINPITITDTVSHIYGDNGVYTVTQTVEDDDGGVTIMTTTTVYVNNVLPIVGEISAPIDPVQVNTVIDTSASFEDAGTLDTHTAVWDWGDVSTSPGTVTEADGSGHVTGSHSYDLPGIYTITLAVTDDDEAAGIMQSSQYVVVYDPYGGFVTGGGWIESPEGAYTTDSSLTGKANFGFVSKYKKGAETPTGQTEFQFKVADLNYHSENYDWLVIAGPRAKYKGTGTINGAGNYGFMLTATDGDLNGGAGVDTFRIKIWDKDNEDTVVYDNKPGSDTEYDGTELGGGRIVIHQN